MQIIQRGTKKARTFRGTCGACGCVFEEQEANLHVQQDQREGTWAAVSCPQCGARAFMSPKSGGQFDDR